MTSDHICLNDHESSESEGRYQQLFLQSGAVMLIIDPDSAAIVDANPAACSFYGYSCKAMRALKIADINITPPAELASCIEEVRNGSRRQFTARHRHFDGTVMVVEVFSNPVVFHGKTLLHSIVVDITERLAAEQELRNKMDFAENLILNSTTPTFVINFDHQVLIWNRAMEELTGIKSEEMVGTDEQWRAFYPSARPCLADIVLNGRVKEAENLYSHISTSRLIPDGLHSEGDYSFDNRCSHLVFSAAPIRDRDGRIIAAIETLEDITERISLEAQLLQSQKMESVGVLAGGVAHDFNNILTIINGYANLLQETLSADNENRNYALEITATVERAAEITHGLLAFSGKHEMQMQHDDLQQILDNIRKSLLRLIREDITITILPASERLPVYVDRVQIEQILINLVVNARDAMESGGTIIISTMPAELEHPLMEGNALIPPGRYACLCVADNGSGISDETLERIFEPFFTTKEKGKGTGLGLAIVQSIVTKHNGFISITGAPGKGTEFRIYLPVYSGGSHLRQMETMQASSCHGTETVLVVEDDAAIMKLLREVLSRYGYHILTAVDGVEAMEVFGAHSGEISIIIVDVIMPRMNGREVVEQIRRQRPKLPIIMTSGYTDDIIDHAGIGSLNVVFLQKPVKPLELLGTIRNCLNV